MCVAFLPSASTESITFILSLSYSVALITTEFETWIWVEVLIGVSQNMDISSSFPISPSDSGIYSPDQSYVAGL